MHDSSHGALVDAAASCTEEGRCATCRLGHRRATALQPERQRVGGRRTVGHRTLLAPLAEDPHHPAAGVEVVDVDTGELADPDAGRIQQLEDRQVAQTLRSVVSERLQGGVEHGPHLGLGQCGGQLAVGLRAGQQRAGIRSRATGAGQPGREHPRRGRPSRHGRAGSAERLQIGQPAAQRTDASAVTDSSHPQPLGMGGETLEIGEIGTNGVNREVTFGHEMPLVVSQRRDPCLAESAAAFVCPFCHRFQCAVGDAVSPRRRAGRAPSPPRAERRIRGVRAGRAT